MKKSIKSNCKSRIRKCTYSPKLNVKDVKIPINSEVNANSSESELQKLMNDIKSAISTKLHRIMTSEFGFEDSEVDDYYRVDVSSVNLGEDHEETIRVEVRVELSYNGMEKVKDALDPIIESYDSYAYFDFDEPGIMSAYVIVDEVDMSVYGSEDEGYWFFTTHGVQPGSVPKDVDILDIIDTPNGSFVKFDRFLSTEELNEYDMKERAPKSVMSSESEERRAEDDPWIQQIDWAMSQLPAWFKVRGSNLDYNVTFNGHTVYVEFFLFDGAKYTYYIDGDGPYTTNQSERIGNDIEDYINENFEDSISATEEEYDEEEYDEEELQDIIDELTADGFDVTDEADLLMGLGADLGMDRADARYYAKLILNHIGAEEDEDSLPMVDQEYDSAATSINSSKLPAIYKMVNFNEGDIIVDFGGGKWDTAVEHFAKEDITILVYDPYNRSAEHNKEVLKILRENGGADAAVNSNVLNVIKEPEARKNVLENIARITKPGAPIYITVYEGKGNGQEGPTKSGYQLNRKTADYLEEIQEVFPDATRKGKLIIAHNSGSVNSSTVAGAESTREYDEPVELEDSEEIIEVDIDVDIYVEDDGEILYENEEKRSDYNWASSDLRGGSWSMNDYPSIVIRNPDDVADDIMDIIYPNIPTRPGRYHISGTAELYYDISGLLTYGDPFGILHDEDIISDNLEVNFNYGKSYIDNLEIKIVDK